MNRSKANVRVHRELDLLSKGSAAPGIAVWARDEGSRLDILDAEICGATETPYEGGVFRLEINIPPEYPLKPPRVKFLTKIYHPNIDSHGRICLDSLAMPPKGAWKPSLSISTLLTSIQALMSAPNPDDGLMADITDEFRRTPQAFNRKAKQFTLKYAVDANNGPDEVQPDDMSRRRNNVSKDVMQTHSDVSTEDTPASKESSKEKEQGENQSRLRKRPRLA